MSKKSKKKASEYAQNLSHELMTPLAIIRSKAEILMQSSNLNGEDLKNLDVILKNVRRMNNLNKSLILLSKIEENVYVDRKVIDIKEISDEILENFEDQIRSKKLSVRYSTIEKTSIESNKTLIDILITNLVKNAIVHNKAGGYIRISLNNQQIQISNSYDESKPPPVNHYKRFTSSKSEEGSLGLGLSIAKRICKYLNLNMASEFNECEYNTTIKFS